MKGRILGENPTKNDIAKIIVDNMNEYISKINSSIITEGIESFSNLEENGRIISFSKCVDTIYSNNDKRNISHKIPTILCGAIMLNKFDSVSNLSDEELATLAHFANIGNSDNISMYVNHYDKKILSEICNKTSNWYERKSILTVVEDTYWILFEKEDDIELINNQLSKFVRLTSLDEFANLKRILDNQIFESMKKGVKIK